MITCQNCGQRIELNAAPGAALIDNGKFLGACPSCGVSTWPELQPSTVKHSDESVLAFIEMMELAGDNFCQRCVDLLLERGWYGQKWQQ